MHIFPQSRWAFGDKWRLAHDWGFLSGLLLLSPSAWLDQFSRNIVGILTGRRGDDSRIGPES